MYNLVISSFEYKWVYTIMIWYCCHYLAVSWVYMEYSWSESLSFVHTYWAKCLSSHAPKSLFRMFFAKNSWQWCPPLEEESGLFPGWGNSNMTLKAKGLEVFQGKGLKFLSKGVLTLDLSLHLISLCDWAFPGGMRNRASHATGKPMVTAVLWIMQPLDSGVEISVFDKHTGNCEN